MTIIAILRALGKCYECVKINHTETKRIVLVIEDGESRRIKKEANEIHDRAL